MADSWDDPRATHQPTVSGTTDPDWGDKVNAGLAFIADPPSIKVRKTGNQAITTAPSDVLSTGNYVKVSWDATSAPGWHNTDYGSFWTSGSVLTVPTASVGNNKGRYLLVCHLIWSNVSGAATDRIEVALCAGSDAGGLSLSDAYVQARGTSPGVRGNTEIVVTAECNLFHGSEIAVWVAHNVGATMNIEAGSSLSATWIGVAP